MWSQRQRPLSLPLVPAPSRQMNLADSERMAGSLEALGYSCVEEPSDADVLIYNTCRWVQAGGGACCHYAAGVALCCCVAGSWCDQLCGRRLLLAAAVAGSGGSLLPCCLPFLS